MYGIELFMHGRACMYVKRITLEKQDTVDGHFDIFTSSKSTKCLEHFGKFMCEHMRHLQTLVKFVMAQIDFYAFLL